MGRKAKEEEILGHRKQTAGQGAERVVFPECLQRYCGDGMGNSRRQTVVAAACKDWRGEMQILLDARCRRGH